MITRILLDTCTVRHLIHGDPHAIDLAAVSPRLWKYRISIADPAIAELLEQRMERKITGAEWESRISVLDQLLDRKWPIFPGGDELAALAGLQTDIAIDRATCQRKYNSLWRLLREHPSLEALKRKIDLEKLKCKIQTDRDEWIPIFSQIQSAANQTPDKYGTLASKKQLLLEMFGHVTTDPNNLNAKLDSVFSLMAHFMHISTQGRSRYNPKTEKRRGDVFDWSLLFALPLPCVIVTADGPFRNTLRQTNSRDAGQVISVHEFNEHSKHDTLESLIAHSRDALQQEHEWREAAYFRWLRRGQPVDDSWADWFACEPIA